MKIVPSLAVLTVLATLGAVSPARGASDAEGVALAILYDTSGSMREPVRDASGQLSPKYLIANRALVAIAKQIQTFAARPAAGSPRRIDTALFTFSGDSAREAVAFGPFDFSAFDSWARHFSKPDGNTPLGNSLRVAAQTVLKSTLPRKHVLVITDGISNVGPPPGAVLPKLQQTAKEKGASLAVHFVAFDVDAKVFDSVKKQGATVVAAVDEKQLNSQLEFILQRQILLEDEEPKK